MIKITYAVFQSDIDNTYESSHANELEVDTKDINVAIAAVHGLTKITESYRGYKIVRIEEIKNASS